MRFLSEIEKDDLRSIVLHDGIKPLLKLVDALVAKQKEALLAVNLESGDTQANLLRLAHAKSRSEGADKLAVALKAEIERLRNPKKPA